MDEQKQIDQIGNEALKLVRQIGTVKINLEKCTEELCPLSRLRSLSLSMAGRTSSTIAAMVRGEMP